MAGPEVDKAGQYLSNELQKEGKGFMFWKYLYSLENTQYAEKCHPFPVLKKDSLNAIKEVLKTFIGI